MLVLTRKTDEVVTIDNWVHVVLTKILEKQITVKVHAAKPFDAVSFPSSVRFPVSRTSFEFVLEPEQWILIGEEITVIFVVARTTERNSEPKARIGFEGPRNTKLCCKDASGIVIDEFELGMGVLNKKEQA